MPICDDILALDLLTLRDHTERAGDSLDADQHAARIRASLELGEVCEVRRHGELVAYALLNHEADGCWFVRGFNTHPAHRSAPVMFELMQSVAALARRVGLTALRSHVYKTNRLSMAFHRRLGFRITRENDKGVEFFLPVDEIVDSPVIARLRAAHPA